ncbi:MAG: HAMP domain-containing histidine kinase [Herpetosiphonaceae bacterium]|nr:HAMP domain-containing histidine kinase [Herpetosiphonaceae bacterium]
MSFAKPNMSLRLRLTLLYSTILALTLVGLSAVIYLSVAQVTQHSLQSTLVAEAQRVRGIRSSNDLEPPDLPFAGVDTFVQARDSQGSVLARTTNLRNAVLPLSPAGLQAVQQGQPVFETVAVDGSNLLVYSTPVLYRGRIPGIIQVARSRVDQQRSLATLGSLLLIGSGIVTLVAFGSGWLLAGIALQPMKRLTQTADTIGRERDFTQRVEYQGPQDEVGQLALTLNRMLAALQAAYDQVAQALYAQRRFVADGSHELRTPLTTIRGNLALLQHEPPISEADRVAVLHDSADEAERMSRLVHDLLVLARADAGQPLHLDAVPVQPLLAEIARHARIVAPEHTVMLGDLPYVLAVADPDSLKQVVLILVDNALKFTAPQGTVTIAATATASHVAISVRDTGPGIDPAKLPHIFERFYRGDASRTGTGMGLGLAIAQTLVTAMQGTLVVESQVGQGSLFTLTLPQAQT